MGWRKRVLHYRIDYLSQVGKKLEQGWAYLQGMLTAESLSHIFFLGGTIKWSWSFLQAWQMSKGNKVRQSRLGKNAIRLELLITVGLEQAYMKNAK